MTLKSGYIFEGGIVPGQVLAAFETPVPSLTLVAPSGSFFVRVRAESGGEISRRVYQLR